MNLLKKLGNCCNPCKDPQIVNVPGEKGDPGNDGAPGEDGINAFTLTTADFVMPASGGNVDVEVGSALWMAGGQIVFIGNAGYFSRRLIRRRRDAMACSAADATAAV